MPFYPGPLRVARDSPTMRRTPPTNVRRSKDAALINVTFLARLTVTRPVRSAAEQTRVQGVWVLLFLKRSPNEAKWALLKAHGPSIGDLASAKYGANSPLHKIRSHMAGSTVPAGPTLNPPNLSQKEDSTVRLSPMDSSSRPFHLASSPSSNGPSA